jgi:hypothetical protein
VVSHSEGGTRAEGVGEEGAEADTWVLEGRGNTGVEKTA